MKKGKTNKRMLPRSDGGGNKEEMRFRGKQVEEKKCVFQSRRLQ